MSGDVDLPLKILWQAGPKCQGECEDLSSSCGSISPSENRYFCTRKEGHEGDHVSCGDLSHEIEVWPNEVKIISDHFNIDECKGYQEEAAKRIWKELGDPLTTLQDLHDKWMGRINGWLVDSAWMLVGRDAGRADAALEALMEDKKK